MLTKDQEINLFGYKKDVSVLRVSDTLANFSQEIKKINDAKKITYIDRMQLSDAILDSQIFFNKYFKLHKVPFIGKIIKIGHKDMYHVKMVSPYNLPIKLEDMGEVSGGYINKMITANKFHPIAFQDIYLEKNVSELTSCSYCHEITHSQLEAMRGSIRHFYNVEVLSIFMGLFHAYVLDTDEKILSLQDSRLMNEISVLAENLQQVTPHQIKINRDNLLEDSKYMSSGLKALQLFSYFYYASDVEKYEIINDIQKVFDGQICVEKFLETYDISYKNPDYQNILKYLKR